MEDTELVALLDRKFAAVEEKLAVVKEKFGDVDKKFAGMDEKFREISMASERIERELERVRTSVSVVEIRVNRLHDEVTLPSGSIGKRFALVEQKIEAGDRETRVLIEQMNGRFDAVNEHIDMLEEKINELGAAT